MSLDKDQKDLITFFNELLDDKNQRDVVNIIFEKEDEKAIIDKLIGFSSSTKKKS